jgi:hypothetical protein
MALLAATACGILPGSAPAATPTPATTVAPTAAATATTQAAATATATAAPLTKPTSTPEPAASGNSVYVGNTDGEGVFLRKTPVMADRLNAYADGTQLTIIGDDVDGDGQHWHHVRAPDGTEGYVPAVYTTDTPQ